MTVNFDLTTVWAFIIAFAVFAYVVMDGFDLGIGSLLRRVVRGPEQHGRAVHRCKDSGMSGSGRHIGHTASPADQSFEKGSPNR